MAVPYFSDTQFGPVPQTADTLPPEAWKGLVSTFHSFKARQYFAESFPEICPDGNLVAGTNEAGLQGKLTAVVRKLTGLPHTLSQPSTATAMDLVVFCWEHVAAAERIGYHSYYSHDHLEFDRKSGREEWRRDVNQILARSGVALEQRADGSCARLGTEPFRIVAARVVRASGDSELDSKIDAALVKYRSPEITVRREALESLWDAFERIKTHLDPSNKNTSTRLLIESMADGSEIREVIERDFRELTSIGNTFQIRHHEVGKLPVEDRVVDLLFVRALNLIELALRSL